MRVLFAIYLENTFYYLEERGIGLNSPVMPQVIYHVATSLDGFIADKDGKVDWLNNFNAFDDQEVMDDFQELMSSFEAILLGGGTYDFALDHGQWMSPGTPSWVFTSRNLPILDSCIQLTSKTPATVIDEIRSKNLHRIWLMGGGKLASTFLKSGLIDEINLAIVPIFLGQGIPLISPPTAEPNLQLIESKSYASGFVSVRYQVR